MLRLPRGPQFWQAALHGQHEGQWMAGSGNEHRTHRQISMQSMPGTELYGKFLSLAKLAILQL